MEVVTVESKAFQELVKKIDIIMDFVYDKQRHNAINEEKMWVDSHDVCNYLHISNRTLQRLRAKNCVSYSRINGKNFFRISDIRHLLESKMIRSNEEYLNDLIQNAKYYAQ
ncbi:MAG TPA: DNA-binding protein [Rikenellaceae bacterium]|nr:DNA-binding protein [Rikenellaceae bacterium]